MNFLVLSGSPGGEISGLFELLTRKTEIGFLYERRGLPEQPVHLFVVTILVEAAVGCGIPVSVTRDLWVNLYVSRGLH